jgi:adenylate cyclase
MGDGFLLEFASVVDAVRCAVDIQRGMATKNTNVPSDRRIELRVGINVGDVVVDGDDLLGDGVNIAARLEGIAEVGGICISETAYQQVRDKLELTFTDAGLQTLKNIARPVRAYRLQFDGAVRNASLALPLPDKPSIAVLPFENMSGDPEQAYFTDGVVEDVITALSHFKQLFVIARNSSFTYKGRNVDVKHVGRELGVRYVVEGSVRKAGNRVRITGQLIDAMTGAHLWADHFDGELADIFDLQDQVTASVVGAIMPQLEKAEIERAKRKPTDSLEAYDLYLHGLALAIETSRETNEKALGLFQQAIALDPGFVLAHALAARCFVYRKVNGWMMDRARDIAEAERLARRTIELGPDDGVALAHAAYVLAYVVGDLDGAASACERSLTVNANAAESWSASSYVRTVLGEPDVGIRHAARAMRISPCDPRTVEFQHMAGFASFFVGRYDEAAVWQERAVRGLPDNQACLRVYAAILAAADRLDEAQQVVARLLRLNPSLRMSNIEHAISMFRRPEDRRKYVEALRTAGIPD